MIWVKLMFLAALGITFATFLGFPVACVASMIIFFGAWGSVYVIDALSFFGRDYNSAYITIVVRWIGVGFTTTLAKFGEYSPAEFVVDGQYISWQATLACIGWIGFVWTGVCGLIGWLVFRCRELARVQV